ncbi:hypothetical protein VPH35_100923 [Triticum aestivum]
MTVRGIQPPSIPRLLGRALHPLTHVTAIVLSSQAMTYKGSRKHSPNPNVHVAVDFHLNFTYVLAGWEGSPMMLFFFSDNMVRPDGINIPDAKFYLVDARYACRHGVLPSFRKIRYHLNEFSSRNHPKAAKELLNLKHSSL